MMSLALNPHAFQPARVDFWSYETNREKAREELTQAQVPDGLAEFGAYAQC
jgi:hypothetical protein